MNGWYYNFMIYYLDKNIKLYFDDIIIYSINFFKLI